MTKDGEDDIVTSLLEDMLAMAPHEPSPASGSGPREDKNIPGAWH